MTTDILGVQDGLGYLHATWSSLFELAFGLYVLYTFVGFACFLLFIPTSSKCFKDADQQQQMTDRC